MSSYPLVPQAKFKSLMVVSTFELGTEEGSVLQLTEASRWSEVGPETEFESCENNDDGYRIGPPVGFSRTKASPSGSRILVFHCRHSCLRFFLLSRRRLFYLGAGFGIV